MVEADDVRRLGLALPRSYEAFIGRRWKLKVRQLVYVAFSRDETAMGFGFPRVERDGLVASDPETFFLPPTSDLRYQWVCARLDRLDEAEMRELVIDAWRMCVPRCCTTCRSCRRPRPRRGQPWPSTGGASCSPLLHPYLHWHDRGGEVRGRTKVLAHLAHAAAPDPTEVEIRDDQVYRWAGRHPGGRRPGW